MKKELKWFYLLVIVSMVFILLSSTVTVTAASGDGSRATGTVTVPEWKVGDKWGYKVPQYTYSSDYYGIGYEVVGSETVNGVDCYDVKIWWDASFGSDQLNYDYNFESTGFEYSYKYVGHAYFTKDKLAIAKFTNDLHMRMRYDGSKLTNLFNTRQIDYSDYLDSMQDWKYDIDYSIKLSQEYNPPFVMYDYPLELDKQWDSTSEVTISWEYYTHIYMNDAMKEYMNDVYGGEVVGLDATEEEGSDTTSYSITGSFEVLGEDTIETDTGSHSVFKIGYNIYPIFTRATRAEPPVNYGGMTVPGGDAALSLAGGAEGEGTAYLDTETGRPEKIESGSGYFTDSYTSVSPDSIENSYSDEIKSSSFSSDNKKSDSGDYTLAILAGIIAVVMILVIVLLIFLIKRMNRQPPTGEQNPAAPQYNTGQPYPPPAWQSPPPAQPPSGPPTAAPAQPTHPPQPRPVPQPQPQHPPQNPPQY
jgi:hypothetical protein